MINNFIPTPKSTAIQEYAILPAEDSSPAELFVVFRSNKVIYNYRLTPAQLANWLEPDAKLGKLLTEIRKSQ